MMVIKMFKKKIISLILIALLAISSIGTCNAINTNTTTYNVKFEDSGNSKIADRGEIKLVYGNLEPEKFRFYVEKSKTTSFVMPIDILSGGLMSLKKD